MKRRIETWLVLIIGMLLVAACAVTPVAPRGTGAAGDQLEGELVVLAAASLTDAFSAMGEAFSAAYPAGEVTFSFAGSQQLAQQLDQGASADVFASADGRQMAVAIASGRVASETVQIFARNQLVLIVPADNPAGIETLEDLTQPGIKLVLAAEEVPVGAYTRDFLTKASAVDVAEAFGPAYGAAVLANVVSYEQNVRAVLSKVALGEADAGLVYASDVTLDAAQAVQRIAIPDALNTVAEYPIAPVVDADAPALAEAFIAFVLSEEGQAILARYGFVPVNPAP